MKHTPELLVYKASAGSGKTFTLAVEFIKQLVTDPRAYREILAVTFTNKATGEMKERILSQLYGIWMGDADSRFYLEAICRDLSLEPATVRERAGEALQLMIHDYNRFRVETIDSFFQSVMRHLARELELGANLRIELDDTEALSDAVDTMIEQLDRRSPELHWILEFIDERISDDKRWDVTDEIKKFAKNILDEVYVEKGARLREKLKDPQVIPSYRRELNDILTEAQNEMLRFGQKFFEVLEAHGLSENDLPYKSSGVASYFHKLQQGKTGDDIFGVRARTYWGTDEWAANTSPLKDKINELARTKLRHMLKKAEECRPKDNRIINSCKLSLKYVNHLRLLNHIDQEMRRQNHEKNRFLLAATNALLHRLVREGDSSFVYEKLGTCIRHVMIDEFQDTSKLQWQNFRQLLLEGLSQGEDSLIVGDVKQSIYRWRNGDWRILNGLRNKLEAFPVRVETLTTNRRSEGVVIHFNNAIFRASVNWLNERHRADANGQDCTPLLDAYADVEQLVGKKDPDKGYVEVNFLPKRDDISYLEDTLERLKERVEELVESGVSLKDIAILVRNNKSIPEIANYFDAHQSYKIVSDEAFRLDASPAVRMLIAALRYLTNEEDNVSLAELAIDYQHEVTHSITDLKDMLMQQIETFLPRDFIAAKDRLRLMPLYELLEQLLGLLQLDRIPQQEAYLCAFFDAVTEYLKDNSSDPTLFLAYWDERLAAKTVPSGEVEGIRILSIHKSKGLEYHTVLIPFCDWNIEKDPRIIHRLWCEPQEEPFNGLDLLPIEYSDSMNQSIYQQDYLEERVQLWVDNLNVLYVAFTRARANLIIWSKEEAKNTVSEMLQAVMGTVVPQGPEPGDPTRIQYRLGTLCPSTEKKAETTTNKLLTPASPIPLHMESIATKVEFKQSNRSAQFIAGDDSEDSDSYIRRGLLLHALFSEIHTPKDVPQAIERLRFDGLIRSKEDEEHILKLVNWALGHPKVKEWFSGDWQLYNECEILERDSTGHLQTHRPDRVMRRGDEVVVVDFKFGKKRAEYPRQVKRYMELIQKMGYTDVKGYLWYVYLNELEEVFI